MLRVFQFCTNCQQYIGNRLAGNVVYQSDGVNRHRMSSIAAAATERSVTAQQVRAMDTRTPCVGATEFLLLCPVL